MANRIFIEGNTLVIEQGTAVKNIPITDLFYTFNDTQNSYSIKGSRSMQTALILKGDITSYTNELGVAYTETTFNTLLRENSFLTL
jgi:hypothetical protein